MMSHARGRFELEEVTGGCLEEVQNGCILPRGRVRHIHHRGGALQRISESLAGDGVYAGRGRRRYYFLPTLAKILDKLRSNKSRTANYDDFHDCSFRS